MLYVNQRIEMYTLIVYFIHGNNVNIMLNHHLQLKVQCDFTYVIEGFFKVQS
jgi:hypothetical protein